MVEPYFIEPSTTIYCGNALEVLAQLPEQSIQMVVTSPPYWGLRKYSGEQELIWGGDKDCEHQWVSREWLMHSGRGDAQKSGKYSAQEPVPDMPASDATCFKCNAWHGAFGLEPTPELYIEHSMLFLQAIKRVLKDDGVVWWNLGDSYWGGKGQSGQGSPEYQEARQDVSLNKPYHQIGGQKQTRPSDGTHPILKPLDLCLIPYHFAIAAQKEGWYVRSDVLWNKGNPMPESVNSIRWERHKVRVGEAKKSRHTTKADRPLETSAYNYRGDGWEEQAIEGRGVSEYRDCPGCQICEPNDGLVLRKGSWRPTTAHEYIFMLTKTDNYYSDIEAVREKYTEPLDRWGGDFFRDSSHKYIDMGGYDGQQKFGATSMFREGRAVRPVESGRNLRSVWDINTEAFDLEMCKQCKRIYISSQFMKLAQTNSRKICSCGSKEWLSHFAVYPSELPQKCILASTSEKGNCLKCGKSWVRIVESETNSDRNRPDGFGTDVHGLGACGTVTINTTGWKPQCNCKAETEPAVVLDLFAGSGTTGIAAKELGRKSILIDTSEDYCRLMKYQLEKIAIPMKL